MKKQLHVLHADESITDILLAFVWDELLHCPKDKPRNFRAKKSYTEDEKRVMNMIPNVAATIDWHCPIGCSGLRGDGTRFRRRCKHFISYGKNNDKVFNFHNPQKFVNCKEYGKVRIKKYASSCEKRKLIVGVARKRELIHHWGSADLENVSRATCLKCNDFDKKEDMCKFKAACKKGRDYILYPDCTWGDCRTCTERRLK